MSDYWVTVCEVCRTASCWHNKFLCERSATAGLVDVPASVLRTEDREHPTHYSRERVLAVCGEVKEVQP